MTDDGSISSEGRNAAMPAPETLPALSTSPSAFWVKRRVIGGKFDAVFGP